MKLLITRPTENSRKLAEHIASMGYESVSSPLFAIEFRRSGELSLEGVQAFIVTSANGVAGLEQVTTNRSLPLYAVGDKTAEAAKKAGFVDISSANGDVDTLAALIAEKASPEDGVMLHAGGARLAGDLQDHLQGSGFRYRRETLYEAVEANDFHSDAISALKDGTLDGVLLFSPQTAKIFTKIVEQKGLSPHLKGVTAWCLSNNVAMEIAELPFKESYIAPSPTEASLLGQLAVKTEISSGSIKMDTDGTRGRIVSKTPKQDTKAGDRKTSGAPDEKMTNSGIKNPTADVKKPLPNALTGDTGSIAKKPAKPAKSNAGWITLALFLVFCLGLAAWPLILPKVGPYLPPETRQIIQGYLGSPENDQNFAQRLAVLEKSQGNQTDTAIDMGPVTATLKENMALVANLQGQVKDLAEKSDLQQSRLSDRLQMAENQSQDLTATISALKEQILKIQLTGSTGGSTSSMAQNAADPAPEILASLNSQQAALDQLKSDLASMRRDVVGTQNQATAQKDQLNTLSVALQTRIAADTENSANDNEALLLLALGQLHRESRTQQPFEGALRQTIAVAPDGFQADLAALADVAKTGALSRSDLINNFAIIANDITQASRLPSSETWYGKTLHNIASLVKFRRVDDVTGDSVDAIVARAEAQLQINDLSGAVDALKGLSGEPASVADQWVTDAQKRTLVDTAISQFIGKATAIAVDNNATDK